MVYSYLFPICYLEHLDSLRLRHAKQLMSWVRLHIYWLYPCIRIQWDVPHQESACILGKISMFFAESNFEHYVKLILAQLSG